ncbi:MAG: hypothetical protein ABS864_03450 [Aerococcus urinaeequi]
MTIAGTVQFLTFFQNNGFMGLLLILALYGPDTTFYTSLINIPTNFFIYSFGVWTMSRGNDTDLHPKQLAKRLLLSTLVSVGPIPLLINALGLV